MMMLLCREMSTKNRSDVLIEQKERDKERLFSSFSDRTQEKPERTEKMFRTLEDS